MKKLIQLALALLFLAVTACSSDSSTEPGGGSIPETNDLGITAVPASMGSVYTKNFSSYTKVTAPNGKAIHIVAQDKLTEEQIIKARNVLEHYLTNLPGSLYGMDKGEIANNMANNNAILLLGNGHDSEDNPINTLELDGQPLFQEELVAEGSNWYINNMYDGHRDASFEEILHLVHDYGIGIDDVNNNGSGTPGVLVDTYQLEIREATVNAMANHLWPTVEAGAQTQDWIDELAEENSLTQEYMASVIDSYYGLWGAFTENNGGMWGIYAAKTREEIATKDPEGWALLDKFFHSYLTYNARLDRNFDGIFSLKFDEAQPYTYKSQYLMDVTLTGTNDSGVRVNGFDNDITGNGSDNVVEFSGASTEYLIETAGKVTTVRDNIDSRDGKNTLRSVERLKFVDKTVVLEAR